MDDREIDKLLEQAFSGSDAPAEFGRRVLRDSTAALALGQSKRRAWRIPALVAAAVFIAVVSFLSGRASVSDRQTEIVAIPTDPETVSVPNELVAWLEAARFFKQLGMDERVASAYERAEQLVPQDVPIAGNVPTTYATEAITPSEQNQEESPVQKTPVILAHSFGG